HPDNIWVYRMMGSTLAALRRPTDAEQVWRSLLKYDSSNAQGNLALGALLVRQKKYDEAIPLLKKAASAKDAAVGVQQELGTAELEGGQKEAGIATLEQVMRTSNDPGIINDAAYALADHDDDVAEAATFAVKALHTVEASTCNINLATLTNQDLMRISQLGAIWDTVGWIDFKQAKYADAERYVRAAWLLGQNPDVATHLGEIYQREGKLAEARHMRKLTAAKAPVPPPQASKIQVTFKSASAHRTDAELYLQEVQNLRTVQISGLPRKMAAAQFWLVFSPRGVEEIKMITGDAALSKAADQIKKHKYPQTFPDPGPVKIVRRGVLSCSQFTSTCQLVLLQPQWTQL
ncbi:MAG: tetratricopeptide repeat protein, partial [Acidobacteriaceae bacterium]